jgi:hypothetical protein
MLLTNSQIIDVALQVNPPDSIDLLNVTIPTINIIATNAGPGGPGDISIIAGNVGPRGPQGDSGQWVALTQSEYDLLNPPDPDVLYVIIQ